MNLNTEPRLADPDGLFAALMDAHRDLDPAASRRFDAQLVLLLANHIGDDAVIHAAIGIARSLLPVQTEALEAPEQEDVP